MNYYLIKSFVEIFKPTKQKILEVGSFIVAGQEKEMSFRKLFWNNIYTGIDLRPGNGVDKIENIEKLTFKNNSFDIIICIDTIEHVENPIKAVSEMFRVLKPNGILILSSVMNFGIHEFPSDYWRFTPFIFEQITKKFGQKYIGYYGSPSYPQNIYAICTKEKNHIFLKKTELLISLITNISIMSFRQNIIHYLADTYRHLLRLFYIFNIKFKKLH